MTLQSTLLFVTAVAMGRTDILKHGIGVDEKKERAEFQKFLEERKIDSPRVRAPGFMVGVYIGRAEMW